MTKNTLNTNWKLMLCFFTLSFQLVILGQNVSKLPYGVHGIWSKNTSDKIPLKKWEAQWIWMPENIQSDVMLARRSFNLNEIPNEAILRISASSKYELYINGKAICQGPARSAPHHQSFDVLDIKSVLNIGKNTIAVRVHYQKGTVSYHLNGRAGLLVQLDLGNTNSSETIISDKNWKVNADTSWDNNSSQMNRFQLVVNDNIDFNKKINDFETINFDDTNWIQAIPLLRNSGWPAPKKDEKATTLTTPWTSLVARDIPYLKETEIKTINLVEAKKIQHLDTNNLLPINSVELTASIEKNISKKFKNFQQKNEPLTLSASEQNETWFLLFDFGKVINGMIKLEIEGDKNTKVFLLESPFIINQKFTHKIVDSEFADQLTLSGNKDTWQSMYFKPTRYLAIAVKGNRESIQIHSVGIHQISYPFELKGSISTPEAPWVEDLWNASAKTIDVCTTDAFTDNYRERRQYAQTGYYAALGNYFTYGDTELQKKYLIQIAQEQEANGLMPAYAPLTGDDYMVILDSNCLWIRSLYNYYLYSGDIETVNELLPAAQKLIQLLISYTNELGLLDNPPYSYWLDHTLNDRKGANLCLNGHFLGALDDFSQLMTCLDKEQEGKIYKEQAELIRKSIANNFWDEENQLFADAYIDGERSNQFSEHANAMALACKIATPIQADLVAKQLLTKDNHNFIKRENGMTMVSPAMSYFLHRGLADYGYEEASLKLLNERFGKMLNTNTNKTLWEEWWLDGTGRTGKFQERTRSDAQTESAFPPALFAKYLLGIEVTKPGMKEIIISKPNTTLKQVSGKIPTPNGIISVKWLFHSKMELSLEIPENIKVKIDIFSLKNDLNQVILNGEPIESNSHYTIIEKGTHRITF